MTASRSRTDAGRNGANPTGLVEGIAVLTGAAAVQELNVTYDEVGKRVSALLEPRTTADVATGSPPNVPSTLARIDAAVGNANQWLGDAELQTDAKGLVKQASTVLTDASDAVQQWRTTGKTVDDHVAKAGENLAGTSTRLNASLDTLDEAAREARQTMRTLNSGQGTLGMLLVNPDLYRSLQSAAERLEKTLVEAQLLIEKYRKEGVPIQF